jgi:hypothetical protein
VLPIAVQGISPPACLPGAIACEACRLPLWSGSCRCRLTRSSTGTGTTRLRPTRSTAKPTCRAAVSQVNRGAQENKTISPGNARGSPHANPVSERDKCAFGRAGYLDYSATQVPRTK